MMGFLVSLGIFFLAIIISQSTLVGQTTAEGVLEFPKNDIQDLRHDVLQVEKLTRESCPGGLGSPACTNIINDTKEDIRLISLYRKSAIVDITLPTACSDNKRVVGIHYNNGVTAYDESPITFYCQP